jgi:hypothetical protein
MYRGAIAAAVDQDGDGIASGREYAAQTSAAEGATRLASLDRDGNGKVTADEFAQGVDDPLATNRVAAVERLRHWIARFRALHFLVPTLAVPLASLGSDDVPARACISRLYRQVMARTA